MPSEPLSFSIITVCRNNVTTLEKAILSVKRQTWPYKEHIIIDGASTDKTPEIIARYQNVISHAISEQDSGIYDAMNKGLDRATGDIICFLNADDEYASDDILIDVAQKMQEEELDALFGDVVFFNANNPEKITRRYRSDKFTPKMLEWGLMPAHPALFLKRDVIIKTGRFDTSFKIAGDYDFVIRAFYERQTNFACLPKILVRMQTGGISTKNIASKILLNREVMRACRKNNVQTNWLKILSKYPGKFLETIFK